jgi:hypothetical protein
MTTELLSTGSMATRLRPWTLELDAELAPGRAAVTPGQAAALTRLLAHVHGVGLVSVRPHCAGRLVLVRLAVEALDLHDAVDRASAFLHSCAVDAGLSPIVLVAARHAPD